MWPGVLWTNSEALLPDSRGRFKRICLIESMSPILDGELVAVRDLVHQFLLMIRKRQNDHLEEWLKRCSNFPAKELRNFVHGLKRDEAAVEAALVQPWSNGQVEGHVNRLKFYKRQMYGRAKFDLLRIRVLSAI